MVDITSKSNTLRKATAVATIVVSKEETIEAIQNRKVPKGDVFEFSRAAGLLGIKKTSDLIPDCHPLPIEYAAFTYEMEGMQVHIKAEVHTIYKTGVEVEAMHGASIAAITMYDMLKPIDKGVYISTIKLLNKSGGKTDFRKQLPHEINACIIVCSDTVSKGLKEDTAGARVADKMAKHQVNVLDKIVIPDDVAQIQALAIKYSADPNCQMILYVGGTGLGPYDVTPDALRTLITREIPGVMETARDYGQDRMPYAMLSRGLAGFIEDTLVLTLPGSPNGAGETIDALFPQILHVFKMIAGERHD
jgi:cyclic pyranopterin monophosphate synthase